MRNIGIALLLVSVLVLGVVGGVVAQDDLENTYVSNNGAFTITYPEDWVAMEDEGSIIIATADDVPEQEPFLPDSVMLYLFLPDLLPMFDLETDTPPADVLETLVDIFEDEETIFGDSELLAIGEAEFELDFVPAAMAGVGEGILGAMALEEGTVAFWGMAADGEWADAEPLIMAMLESASYVLPELELPEGNAIAWETDTVSLSAENFYIVAGGKVYTAAVDEVDIDGDPGYEDYTTLEVTWEEHGTPMRVYIYFEADEEDWYAFEIRTYDGSEYGEWIYYEDTYFTTPMGEMYEDDDFSAGLGSAGLFFEGLKLQAFTE